MARYETLRDLHTGCKRRPRYLWPAGVVIEFDPNNPRVKTWVKTQAMKQVPDDTPLTEPAAIKEKMRPLMRR